MLAFIYIAILGMCVPQTTSESDGSTESSESNYYDDSEEVEISEDKKYFPNQDVGKASIVLLLEFARVCKLKRCSKEVGTKCELQI